MNPTLTSATATRSRKPVHRLFTGLVDRPFEPPAELVKRGRGRPPKYASKEEKNAAHAAARRAARERKRVNREQRRQQRRTAHLPTQTPITDWEATLELNIKNGAPQSVLDYIREEIDRENSIKEYERDEAREQRRDHKRNAVTVEDINRGAWMKRGLYASDAPSGKGLLSTGEDVIEISDAQQIREDIGGKRVTPEGFSSRDHEETDYRKQPTETESQFMDKHFPESKLRCYATFGGKPCLFEVVGILPQDVDKPRDT